MNSFYDWISNWTSSIGRSFLETSSPRVSPRNRGVQNSIFSFLFSLLLKDIFDIFYNYSHSGC